MRARTNEFDAMNWENPIFWFVLGLALGMTLMHFFMKITQPPD